RIVFSFKYNDPDGLVKVFENFYFKTINKLKNNLYKNFTKGIFCIINTCNFTIADHQGGIDVGDD
ncbi:MAG: hypothetical protein PVH42_15390, partial [Desulfobacterales bacterium]